MLDGGGSRDGAQYALVGRFFRANPPRHNRLLLALLSGANTTHHLLPGGRRCDVRDEAKLRSLTPFDLPPRAADTRTRSPTAVRLPTKHEDISAEVNPPRSHTNDMSHSVGAGRLTNNSEVLRTDGHNVIAER